MKRWSSSVVLVVALAMPGAAPGADGAAVYEATCASCHGADGAGKTPVGRRMRLRDLGSAEVQQQTDAQLAETTAKGKGRMQGFEGKLSPEEIEAVVAHLRTFAK